MNNLIVRISMTKLFAFFSWLQFVLGLLLLALFPWAEDDKVSIHVFLSLGKFFTAALFNHLQHERIKKLINLSIIFFRIFALGFLELNFSGMAVQAAFFGVNFFKENDKVYNLEIDLKNEKSTNTD